MALSNTQLAEIRRRFEAGERKNAIAKAMGISAGAVSLHTPPVNPHLPLEIIQEMVRLVESGKTRIEVAAQFGVDSDTVAKYTKHITPRAVNEIPPEIRADIVRRLNAGETVNSIARAIKISVSYIRKIKNKTLGDFKLTEAQNESIQAARTEGKTYSQIAAEFQIPITAVFRAFGYYSGMRYSEEQRKAAIEAIASGESQYLVAERIGASRATVNTWFEDAVSKGEVQKPAKILEKRDDHKFAWITRRDPELEEWRQLIVSWCESENPSTSSAISAVSAFIDRYLLALNLPKKPADLLQRGRLLPDFYEKACPKGQTGRQYSVKIYQLIEWILDSPGFADTDGGEPIRIVDLYRNPINPNVGVSDTQDRKTESTKVVLPYFLISDLRKRVVQGPNFSDWTWVQGLGGIETLNGKSRAGDWFPVTEDRIDRNDPDCVWRLRQREMKTPVLEMWSPVRWVHALVHLQTTTRGGQLRMVDSGEADTFIWKEGQFIPNPGPLRLGTARKPRQQGVFLRPSPEDAAQGSTILLYFNSNKTADKGKTGSAKGFECPWPQMPNIEEDPYVWLAKLRDWQIKYNPINGLTKWQELKSHAKLSTKSEEQAAEYPDTAFLFRAPENTDNPDWPIYSNQCSNTWQKLLAAYEFILAEEGIKQPSGTPIELINPTTGVAWSSPHSTRVSLITHLILDGDVPPVVMMKIAGHARFIMTIYYTKAGLTGIQNAIKAGAERIDKAKYQTFERDLLSTTAEQMRRKVVFNAEDWKVVLPVNPADRNPLGWLHLHDGICLAGGNTEGDAYIPGCHNGGPPLRSLGARKPIHGPVPGGVRNCCRCRWKAAGKQHILGLAATYDNRAYHTHKAKDEAIDAERERNRLMQDKARVESASEPYTRMRDLIDAERCHEKAMQTFQELALDVAALHRIIERIMALPENAADDPTALAAQGDLLTVNMVIEEIDSELLQLAGVCADVELFPDLDPGTAVFEFAQLLDHAFEREGQPMVLARLSEKEKLVTANAIMRELERKAKPDNSFLGRRRVVEIMDRGESLEQMLGVKLKNIIQLTDHGGRKPVSLRLVQKDTEEGKDDDQYRAS